MINQVYHQYVHGNHNITIKGDMNLTCYGLKGPRNPINKVTNSYGNLYNFILRKLKCLLMVSHFGCQIIDISSKITIRSNAKV